VSAPALVEVRNLVKTFGPIRAVDGVSFEARAGEIFGLLGPNGAGKTTTLRVLATVLSPTAGSVRVAGFDAAAEGREVRRRVGMLTAAVGVYSRLTARENVAYFGRLHGMNGAALDRRIAELFDTLGIREYADRRCEGLSTGMRQKVALARTLVHDPPVVILDEPTAGLDVLGAEAVERVMVEARARGRCVLLSTHLLWEAEKFCDRAAIIHLGRLVACGPVAALEASTGAPNLERAFLKLIGHG
jgi:sodium transport system ATP-binding protein